MQAHPPLSCIANRSCPGTNPLCAMNSTVWDPLGDFRDNGNDGAKSTSYGPPGPRCLATFSKQQASKQACEQASKQASSKRGCPALGLCFTRRGLYAAPGGLHYNTLG